ncbi:MAG: hydrogenase formation protein HypD [Lachnospiraceae bacterium]|jgi:hydrogenase expression/formation protein HypD|nr:hydrogenase formation protein HypD [Lachnospiraceae bacterium]
MDKLAEIRDFLAAYDGPPVHIMEVCGTHTAAVAKNGIPSLLSPSVHLISGPGCPVCVTVTDYIDRLVELAETPENVVVSFGDLLRVKGSGRSLAEAKARGAAVDMVYAPLQMLDLAEKDPGRNYIFAAVGFETTAPVYALLLEEADRRGLGNVQLLTSLKTMPRVIDWVCTDAPGRVDGFIAPGHVCAVTGYECYVPLAEKYGIPFVVSGFSGEQLLATIYRLVRLRGQAKVENLYRQVVKPAGNPAALAAIETYFEPCDAAWRGMGMIRGSGLVLRSRFRSRDAGSSGLDGDHAGEGCCCAQVLTGRIAPPQCPLFGKACTPQDPHGACMVSQEGSCYNYFITGRGADAR